MLLRINLGGVRRWIIALSAHAFDAERRKCLEAGMTEYLAKPIDPASLITLLSRVADRSGTASPARTPALRTAP